MTTKDVRKAGRLSAEKDGVTYTIMRSVAHRRWSGWQSDRGWVGSFSSLNAAVAWIERNTGRHFAEV